MMISSLLFLFPRIVWKIGCYPVLLCLLRFILQLILTEEPKEPSQPLWCLHFWYWHDVSLFKHMRQIWRIWKQLVLENYSDFTVVGLPINSSRVCRDIVLKMSFFQQPRLINYKSPVITSNPHKSMNHSRSGETGFGPSSQSYVWLSLKSTWWQHDSPSIHGGSLQSWL